MLIGLSQELFGAVSELFSAVSENEYLRAKQMLEQHGVALKQVAGPLLITSADKGFQDMVQLLLDHDVPPNTHDAVHGCVSRPDACRLGTRRCTPPLSGGMWRSHRCCSNTRLLLVHPWQGSI